MQELKDKSQITDGYSLACLYKYYRQETKKNLKFKLNLSSIKSKKIYLENQKIFDKLILFLIKYKINIDSYMLFCSIKADIDEYNISKMLNINTVLKYCDWLKAEKLEKNIYNDVIESAKYIANETIKLGYLTVKDYLRHIIKNNMLASLFVSGKISIYYLAAIPGFKKIIPKLDIIAKNEFNHLYNMFEVYNSKVVFVFLKKKNIKINPIKMTDDLIFKFKSIKYV